MDRKRRRELFLCVKLLEAALGFLRSAVWKLAAFSRNSIGFNFGVILDSLGILSSVCVCDSDADLFKKLFYWNIVDLQCANFCCTAKWFSYMYIYILFSYSFPLWFIAGYWIWFPVLYSKPCCFIHSVYNSLYLLILQTHCFFQKCLNNAKKLHKYQNPLALHSQRLQLFSSILAAH